MSGPEYGMKPSLLPPAVYTFGTEEGKAAIENRENGFLDGTRRWQGIPGIERSEKNGRLWAVWYSGGPGECPENYVILVTSEDDGKTWSDARVIIKPTEPYVRAFDPVLWTDPNGKFWVIWNQEYTHTKAWSGEDGLIGVWGMVTEDASVSDPVWSEPCRLCNNVCMNKPTATRYGWLLPAYMCACGGVQETDPEEMGPCLYRFEEYGRPWKKWSRIDADALPDTALFCEHCMIEQEDGSLKVIIRTSTGIEQCLSADGGASWSRSVPVADGGRKLSATSSRPFWMKLSSGAQLLLYHDSQSAARNNLTAALSWDEGITWRDKLVIDVRNDVSYPDAVQAEDGTIYIVYDYNRYQDREILLCVLTEDRIRQGGVLPDGEKILINNNGAPHRTRYRNDPV